MLGRLQTIRDARLINIRLRCRENGSTSWSFLFLLSHFLVYADINILAELTGKQEDEIAKATSSYDHYFTAEEAVEFGLCDKIITINEMLEVA